MYGRAYPFTAPAMIPEMSWRPASTNSASSGRVASTAPASGRPCATSEAMTGLSGAVRVGVHGVGEVTTAVDEVHARVKDLALAQSADIAARLAREGVRLMAGSARLTAPHVVEVTAADGQVEARVGGHRPAPVGRGSAMSARRARSAAPR